MNKADMQNDNERLERNLKKIKHKILVISGKGGVGKSTVSVNLASGLALRGYKTGLLDIDIHGPSTAKMLGMEGQSLGHTDEGILPLKVNDKLCAVTMAALLEETDTPVIWRGPLKMKVIRQFLADVLWPELDYLIIDSPPGTGDEPLSVCQIIGDVTGAVIITTPQEVSLLDARKTIRFSQLLKVPVLGLIENMSGFICPHCGKVSHIFQSGGGEKTAKEYDISFLGKLPIEMDIVSSGDDGKPYIYNHQDNPTSKSMMAIVDLIVSQVEKGE